MLRQTLLRIGAGLPCLICALEKGTVCPLKDAPLRRADIAEELNAAAGALCLLPWLHVWLRVVGCASLRALCMLALFRTPAFPIKPQ